MLCLASIFLSIVYSSILSSIFNIYPSLTMIEFISKRIDRISKSNPNYYKDSMKNIKNSSLLPIFPENGNPKEWKTESFYETPEKSLDIILRKYFRMKATTNLSHSAIFRKIIDEKNITFKNSIKNFNMDKNKIQNKNYNKDDYYRSPNNGKKIYFISNKDDNTFIPWFLLIVIGSFSSF